MAFKVSFAQAEIRGQHLGVGGGACVQGEGSDYPPVATVSPALPRGQAQVLSISWVTSQYVTKVMG